MFPARKLVACIHVALASNGESSYRDAVHIAELAQKRWGADCTVITDRESLVVPGATIGYVQDAALLLRFITVLVYRYSPDHDILFVMSSHGYSAGVHQFVTLNGEKVTDAQLGQAVYANMHQSSLSLCLLDTCHSGTLLDLRHHTAMDALSITSLPSSVAVAGQSALSIAIGACGDQESSEEGISTAGGWGGGLIAEFLDAFPSTDDDVKVDSKEINQFDVVLFFANIHHKFTHKTIIPGNIVGDRQQHPVMSFTTRAADTYNIQASLRILKGQGQHQSLA